MKDQFTAWLEKITQETEEELQLIRAMKAVQTTSSMIENTHSSLSSTSSSTSSVTSSSSRGSNHVPSQRRQSSWATNKPTEVPPPINDPDISMFEETLLEVNALFEARQVSGMLATEFKQCLEDILATENPRLFGFMPPPQFQWERHPPEAGGGGDPSDSTNQAPSDSGGHDAPPAPRWPYAFAYNYYPPPPGPQQMPTSFLNPDPAASGSSSLRWTDDDVKPLRDEILRLQRRGLVHTFLVGQLRESLETMVRRRLMFYSATSRVNDPTTSSTKRPKAEGSAAMKENAAVLEQSLLLRMPPPPPLPSTLPPASELPRPSERPPSSFGDPAQANTQSPRSALPVPAAVPGDCQTLLAEMEQLKSLVRTCLELQAETQRSIKQEVAAALAGRQSTPPSLPPAQRDSKTRCVRCETGLVDCLLYRCGHVCCCLSCARTLQTGSQPCPVCQAPIVDVVMMYIA